jgi:hypothetical protein
MEGDHPAAADTLAEEETLPGAEEEPATAEEEGPAQEQEADPAAAPRNFQIPPWNLDERIPFAPQEWDADTPQFGVGAADDGVEIIDLEESEQPLVVAEPTRRSPAETRARRRKRPAQRKKGRFIIRLRETSSAHTADATEVEGRPTQTVDNFANPPVQEAPEDAVLATKVARV